MIKTGIYRHFKGNLYSVFAVATHTETGEPLVIYHEMNQSNSTVYARPLSMFGSDVEVDGIKKPRFQLIRQYQSTLNLQ